MADKVSLDIVHAKQEAMHETLIELKLENKENTNKLADLVTAIETRVVSLETTRAVYNSHLKVIYGLFVIVLAAFAGAFFTNFYGKLDGAIVYRSPIQLEGYKGSPTHD